MWLGCIVKLLRSTCIEFDVGVRVAIYNHEYSSLCRIALHNKIVWHNYLSIPIPIPPPHLSGGFYAETGGIRRADSGSHTKDHVWPKAEG